MEWVETTGRSLDEAKEAALDQLGVDEQDAEFEIVEEPRYGLFGRLRSEARVRARVRPTKPRSKDDRRDRRGRRRTTGSDETSSSASPVAASRPAGEQSDAATDRRPNRAPEMPVATDVGNEADKSESAGEQPATGSTSSRHRRRTRASGASRPDAENGGVAAGNERPASAPRPKQNQMNNDPSRGGGMDVSLDEQGEVARQFLEGLLDRMGLDAEIVLERPEDETIELNMQGPDLGLLIGAKGSTLLALQDLTRTVVQRKTSASNGRLMVDVAGYRRKRKEALVRFSKQVAEEVQATGTLKVLEPMTAADRKIVHDTVNDIDGVMTSSEGEDPRRRVVIRPTEH